MVVGRLGRAHGLAGDVAVDVRTDEPDRRFAPGTVLHTDPEADGPLTVASSRTQGGRLLVRFVGISDRAAAEALRGALLVVDVDPDERPEDEEEWYDFQLVGLRALDQHGGLLGEVTQVVHLPSQDLLALRTTDGREALVPFVAAIVPVVDVAGGRVVLDPPPGLLDLGEAR